MRLSEIQKDRKRLGSRMIIDAGRNWQCPECGSTKMEVDYTRPEKKGIYRKRSCTCGTTFETFEKITSTHKP